MDNANPDSIASLPHDAEQAVRIIREHASLSLTALYLHGSAVAGGLRPDSDIDLLAVVSRALSPEDRACLARTMMAISGIPGGAGTARPLELIVFLAADLIPPPYPARCEFMYGEWLRGEFAAGAVPGPLRDPELTLVLAQARGEARALAGPDARELLPAIPASDVRRAMRESLPVVLETLETDTRNVLLTLARMWRTAATGDFVSKDAAADWARARLPREESAVLTLARDAYLGKEKDNWRTVCQAARQTAETLRERVASTLPCS